MHIAQTMKESFLPVQKVFFMSSPKRAPQERIIGPVEESSALKIFID